MGWLIAHDGVRVTIVSCSEAVAMPSLAAYMSSLDPPTPPRDPAFSQRKIPSGNCEVCNKEMAVTSLKRHMTTVHRMKMRKQIECQASGKLFQSKDRLDQHSKTHRLERGGQPFSCPKCNYKMGSKYYLTDHARRMHTAGTGLSMCMVDCCKEKPKTFLNHHQFKQHQQEHAKVTCLELDCNKLFHHRIPKKLFKTQI